MASAALERARRDLSVYREFGTLGFVLKVDIDDAAQAFLPATISANSSAGMRRCEEYLRVT